MSAEARLKELGLVLPKLPKPVANYLPYRLAGNLLFLAGQGPRDENGNSLTGKLGAGVSVEDIDATLDSRISRGASKEWLVNQGAAGMKSHARHLNAAGNLR